MEHPRAVLNALLNRSAELGRAPSEPPEGRRPWFYMVCEVHRRNGLSERFGAGGSPGEFAVLNRVAHATKRVKPKKSPGGQPGHQCYLNLLLL